MPRAIWNGAILAESNTVEIVDGYYYFPLNTINPTYFQPSENHTVCPWKGVASYYDIVVNGRINQGAAWYYPSPKPAARYIGGYVGFWRGVQVQEE